VVVAAAEAKILLALQGRGVTGDKIKSRHHLFLLQHISPSFGAHPLTTVQTQRAPLMLSPTHTRTYTRKLSIFHFPRRFLTRALNKYVFLRW